MPDSLEDQTPLRETMCCQFLTSTTLSQRFPQRNELQVTMAWTNSSRIFSKKVNSAQNPFNGATQWKPSTILKNLKSQLEVGLFERTLIFEQYFAFQTVGQV
jgi:hypothetical protein